MVVESLNKDSFSRLVGICNTMYDYEGLVVVDTLREFKYLLNAVDAFTNNQTKKCRITKSGICHTIEFNNGSRITIVHSMEDARGTRYQSMLTNVAFGKEYTCIWHDEYNDLCMEEESADVSNELDNYLNGFKIAPKKPLCHNV